MTNEEALRWFTDNRERVPSSLIKNEDPEDVALMCKLTPGSHQPAYYVVDLTWDRYKEVVVAPSWEQLFENIGIPYTQAAYPRQQRRLRRLNNDQ